MIAIDILKLKSVLYALFLCGFSFAQDISQEEVKADLNFLKSKILEYQPGIDSTAPRFEKAAENIIAQNQKDSLTYLEYFRAVSRMCVMAGEGHYSIGNWQDTIHKGFGNGTYDYFPADVKVINHKLYIEKDYSNEQKLTAGSEITRINGKSSASILQELYFCIPSDGAIITNILDDLDSGFPYYYYFFVEQSDYYGVTLKDASGKERTVSIEAINRAQQRFNFKEYVLPNSAPTDKENPVYSLDINATHALMTLRSFNNKKLKDQNIKARKFYKSIFDTLRLVSSDNLIIDLRGNSGGLFVMAQEFIPYVMKEEPEDRFQRRSISWDGKTRTYKFRKKKKKKAFEGQIYVLIDGGTFSSASTLARYLKEHAGAILIGEESGSRYEAFAAGSKQYVQLPNSGIEIGIPRFLIEFGEGKKQQTKNRGVLPDHAIQYSMLHVIAGRDLHLEKAEELIEERKSGIMNID